MTEKGAIEYLEITKACSEDGSVGELQKQMCDITIKALEEIQQYREIGTVEECRAAVEKRKPKKVNNRKLLRLFDGRPYCIQGDCPMCGCYGIKSNRTDYCPACGQKLDWSEEE